MKRVYFLRRADGTGPIKIGCSSYPRGRAKQLGMDMKGSFVVLAEAPGDFTLERNLHLKFAADRERPAYIQTRKTPIGGLTEWYAATPELLAIIDDVRRSGAINVPTGECRERVFAQRYTAGETLQSIANDYGITRERVRQVLRDHGVRSLGWRTKRVRREATLRRATA